MKEDDRVIEYLNRSLRAELTAVNQYWLHFRILDNWGYKDLAKKWREELEEMHHADRLITRITFLKGFTNLQVPDPLRIVRVTNRVELAGLFAAGLLTVPGLGAAYALSRPFWQGTLNCPAKARPLSRLELLFGTQKCAVGQPS
jgi:ferritin-like protein